MASLKTFKDLMLLVAREEELNQNKLMQVQIVVNTKHKTISMAKYAEASETTLEDVIINHESYGSVSKLQQMYWTIYNNGRSFDINETHE